MALPILLPPPTNPIGLDPNKDYIYVIPQTGATSITVDPAADFTLAISASLQVLTVTFTGTPTLTTPTTYSITIHVSNGEGTVDQIIKFAVQKTATRIWPRIDSPPSNTVALGAAVSYKITTDISLNLLVAPFTRGTKFALGLPSGLSCDSDTGKISGTPPSTNATYAIVLGAKMAGTFNPPSLRYLLLVVGAGSAIQSSAAIGQGGTTAAATNPSANISNLKILLDGDYTIAQLTGQPVYDAPFSPHDLGLYVYRATYWQLHDSYQEPELNSAGPLGGLYAGTVRGSFKDIAAGVIQFTREYVTVPHPRDEYESFVYGFQWWQCQGGSCSIAEVPKTVMSRVHYDYFQVADSGINGGGWVAGTPVANSWGESSIAAVAQIPLPRAPRVIELFGALYFQNGYGSLVPGQEILAEDACLRQWAGNIYERKQRFVVEQTDLEQTS